MIGENDDIEKEGGESALDESAEPGGENSAENCLARVDNLTANTPCCSACGYGLEEGGEELQVGGDCTVCGGAGTVIEGEQMVSQVQDSARSYHGAGAE